MRSSALCQRRLESVDGVGVFARARHSFVAAAHPEREGPRPRRAQRSQPVPSLPGRADWSDPHPKRDRGRAGRQAGRQAPPHSSRAADTSYQYSGREKRKTGSAKGNVLQAAAAAVHCVVAREEKKEKPPRRSPAAAIKRARTGRTEKTHDPNPLSLVGPMARHFGFLPQSQ